MKRNSQERMERIAIHEAGHAVMIHLRGMQVTQLVIDLENEDVPGFVDWQGIDSLLCFRDGRSKSKSVVRRYLYTDLLINLAGTKAEQLVTGSTMGGFAGDMENAWIIVGKLTVGKPYEYGSIYLERAGNAATRILEPHKEALSVIAAKLLQNLIISSDDFLNIMKGFDL